MSDHGHKLDMHQAVVEMSTEAGSSKRQWPIMRKVFSRACSNAHVQCAVAKGGNASSHDSHVNRCEEEGLSM